MHFYTDIYLQGTASILNSSGTNILEAKQDSLVSGINIKTINGVSLLGGGNMIIGAVAWGGISGTIANQTDLQACFDSKQATLISGTNIKTINGNSLVGSGDLVVSGGGSTMDGTTLCTTTNISSILPACNTKWNDKQDSLVSGTSIKTINGNSLLGSGNIVISGGGGGLVNFSELVCNVGITTGQNILTPNTLCTNADIILTPKGNGSIARVPALNTTVALTRGCNSVDLATHSLNEYGSMNLSDYSTSSGGLATVNDSSPYGVISGGNNNCNYVSSSSVIAGGVRNCICNSHCSNISGGIYNTIVCYSYNASISGGIYNTIVCYSYNASISGGVNNTIFCSYNASITGGCSNSISSSEGASIKSGIRNNISLSTHSSIGGGLCNGIYSSTMANVSGGSRNNISCSSLYANILGGRYNKIEYSRYATILGGYCNIITSGSEADKYTLLYGQCGQIGINDTSTLFALAYGTGVLTDNINSCNLVFCVTKTGITHTKGICALSGFKLTGLPTTNPGVGTGLLWNNAGVLSIA